MTDTPPPPPAEPTPPASSASAGATPPPAEPTQPAYAAPAGAPGAPAPKQSLSLASFITGIAAFVLSWIFGLGLIPGIVAVVLGFKAKKSEPGAPQWMSLVGIIGGFVGIGLSIIMFFVTVLPFIFAAIFFASIPGMTTY